ncbi:hypothetical protein llap_14591 [Limosa lapponica baueri]|uniref:Uncharacterized protein n=1 Tax=Limosa lapponica baueri TaxID=1758121 RepID=A0A2I0TMX1_LIMLA|nr:hypothetical protein llap_14591 [Limosa lapponica baueri]
MRGVGSEWGEGASCPKEATTGQIQILISESGIIQCRGAAAASEVSCYLLAIKGYSKEKKIKKMETSEDVVMYLEEAVLAGSYGTALSTGVNTENYRSLELLNFVEDGKEISGLKF